MQCQNRSRETIGSEGLLPIASRRRARTVLTPKEVEIVDLRTRRLTTTITTKITNDTLRMVRETARMAEMSTPEPHANTVKERTMTQRNVKHASNVAE